MYKHRSDKTLKIVLALLFEGTNLIPSMFVQVIAGSPPSFRIDISGVIKVADFGLSEDVYSKNYFRQEKGDAEVRLPIKWMALESLQDGVFSEKTDVVSKCLWMGFSVALSELAVVVSLIRRSQYQANMKVLECLHNDVFPELQVNP